MTHLTPDEIRELAHAAACDPNAHLAFQLEQGTHGDVLWIDAVLSFQDADGDLRAYPLHSVLIDRLTPHTTRTSWDRADAWLKAAQTQLTALITEEYQTTAISPAA